MKINDTREVLTGSVVGLVVATLQFESLLVDDFDICTFDFHGVSFEKLPTLVSRSLPKS